MRRASLALAATLLAGCGVDAAPRAAPAGESILAITTPPDGSSTVLSRFDADTLAPREGRFDLGAYHDAWAFSPDHRTLALGTFARTGVRLIDPVSLRPERDVPMPIAAIGVGWVSAERVAVLLQSGGVILMNSATWPNPAAPARRAPPGIARSWAGPIGPAAIVDPRSLRVVLIARSAASPGPCRQRVRQAAPRDAIAESAAPGTLRSWFRDAWRARPRRWPASARPLVGRRRLARPPDAGRAPRRSRSIGQPPPPMTGSRAGGALVGDQSSMPTSAPAAQGRPRRRQAARTPGRAAHDRQRDLVRASLLLGR